MTTSLKTPTRPDNRFSGKPASALSMLINLVLNRLPPSKKYKQNTVFRQAGSWVDFSNSLKTINPASYFLVMIVLGCAFGCTTSKGKQYLDRQIYGYVTFGGMEIAVDDDDVSIELSFLPHADGQYQKNAIMGRIKEELADIAQKSDFSYKIISENTSASRFKISVEKYSDVSLFFQNLINRLRVRTLNPKRFPTPVFDVKLTHEPAENKAVVKYTRGLFEPRALISLKTADGGLAFEPENSKTTLLYKTAENFVQYVINPSRKDSLYKDNSDVLNFKFAKPKPAWYSFERIRSIFSDNSEVDPKDALPGKINVVNTRLRETPENVPGPGSIVQILTWVNDRLNWIATILIPILAFIGVSSIKKVTEFLGF